jgi:hypothetical protein
MNTEQPLYVLAEGGEHYDLSPAGVLLLAAGMAYGPNDDPEWTGESKAEAMVLDILSAAQGGGYTKTDILHTLLVRNERSKRVAAMAREACAAAGSDRFAALMSAWKVGQSRAKP